MKIPLASYTKRNRLGQGTNPRILNRRDTISHLSKEHLPSSVFMELADNSGFVSKVAICDGMRVIENLDRRHKYSECKKAGS
jgi:hypothetical protein